MANRLKKLLIPHLTMATITAVCSCARVGVKNGSFRMEMFWTPYTYWFLPVLSMCLLFMTLSFRITNDKCRASILCLLTSAILVYPSFIFTDHLETNVSNTLLQDSLRILSITPTALLFFTIGSLGKDVVTNYFSHYDFNINRGIINILLICLFVFIAERNSFVFMYINQYGIHYPLFLICALLGGYCCLVISKFLEYSQVLQWAGTNSICLYVWNFVVCGNCVTLAGMINKYFSINATALSMVSFAFAFSVIVVLTKFTKNKFGYLYGF